MDIIKTISDLFDTMYKKNYLLYIIIVLVLLFLISFLKTCSQDSVGIIFNDSIINESDYNINNINQTFNNETINYSLNNLTEYIDSDEKT